MSSDREDTLVVDLDGTLVRSDMLYESFWSAFGKDWRTPFTSIAPLTRGRAALKQHLARSSSVESTTLPFDPEVVAYVREQRQNGTRTALVTASDHVFAERIAEHLGIFDEVHGSDGTGNLKGEAKAAFLSERFGKNAFSYMGDSAADLHVWKDAKKIITVNAPQAVQRKAETLGKPYEHLSTAAPSVRSYVKALRPHQWLKNVLVFLPMLAGHALNLETFLLSVVAFIAFSLAASCAYVLNDLLDLSADRAHPRKRRRPFASGAIPIAHGLVMALGLLLLSALLAGSLGGMCLLALAAYFVLTMAYSLDFKRRIVIDICVLAGLYTMRIIVGGYATGIPLSVWLLAFSIFFFFSLAAVKRQAELVDMVSRNELQAKGRGYKVEDLPIISMMALGAGYVSVLVMALYVNSPTVVELYPNPAALWGICCTLLYWLTRMVFVTHRGYMHDDPVLYAAKDRISRICLLAVFTFAVAGAVW